jgi:hypothetical protein
MGEYKMSRNRKVEIVKIPRTSHPNPRPQTFPRMPRLYLELIQNNTKIKQDKIGTEYVHVYGSPEPEPPKTSVAEEFAPVERAPDPLGMLVGDSDDDVSGYESRNDSRKESDVGLDNRSVVSVSTIGSRSAVSSADEGSVSKRLENLLGDDDTTVASSKSNRDKYKKTRDRSGASLEKKFDKVAPSYSELEAAGAFVPRRELKDISVEPEIERNTDDMKRELLFKFELLRKSYPDSTIPEYTVHTDYKTMVMSYEDCVRRLSLDSSVESFKQYLIYAFMALEFGLGKFLKLDMEGFTQQQIISMSSYEKLLIELGEKSYVPEGSEWSVEVRLLGLVLMNTAFFVVSKMVMNKTNVNLMNMMNGMTGTAKGGGGGDDDDQVEPLPQVKRGMKPPTFDLSDL